MQFRKDINGLRAIAVIAVVLFHFNASWMPGGFAGVDVFFVISGFLMTGIIFRGIEQENFSILKFYVARANRIIPALAVLCLALLVFGWFYLTPLDYKVLGKHVGSSMGFLSNIIYWRESGYFDAASHEKWLLHTWSLSAEWQFYIIYPLVLVAMRKFISLKAMKATVLVGTVLGFIFCVIATYKWPNPAYYLLPTRAWEMMIGGVAYLYPLKLAENRKKVFEWVGLALIILSYIFISKENLWPGYLALIPVFGAFLIIQAQRNDSIVTGNIVFQSLGKWSYSIYLWHWPIVVGIYYYSLNGLFIYTGVLLSLLLGFISNKYIESIGLENNFKSLMQYFKCKPIYMTLFVGLLGSYTFLSQGVDGRFEIDNEKKLLISEIKMPLRTNGYCFYSFNDGQEEISEDAGSDCYLGDISNKSSTLLFGDSYAGHNEPFFDEIFKRNNKSFQSIVTNWCIASFTDNFTGPKTHNAYKQCLINRSYLKKNLKNYKNVIFAGSWDSALSKNQLDDFKLVVDEASNMGVNVFIMAAPHRYENSIMKKFYRSIYFNSDFDINEVSDKDHKMKIANSQLKDLSKKYENVHFIDRKELFNATNTFRINKLEVPYSLDGGHISIIGSKYSALHFMNSENYVNTMKYFN
ncbi:MAG: acyltransferase [Algicola sp.]|nr:acyltransferase [Algicola sp.]